MISVEIMSMKSNLLKQIVFQNIIVGPTVVCDMFSTVYLLSYLQMPLYI